MERPLEHYWSIRLEAVRDALEKNSFEAYVAPDREHAKTLVLEQILATTGTRSVSWGGSQSFTSTGLYAALKERTDLHVLDTFAKDQSPQEKEEIRRQALLVDLFITGTNAILESGKLVNLDMIGNRVAALTFGPRHVVVIAGRNKIVPDIEEAFTRIKNYAAPANAMRLDKKTPCVKTSFCEECRSPDRICNVWSIHEKSFPAQRIKVILVNEDLGL
jgi:L-lactate utilization protein LutB